MPVTIFYLFLSQLFLTGVIQVYRNQMYLYQLTKHHYQAQTLLAYTEYWIQSKNAERTYEERDIPVALVFQEGTVSCAESGGEAITATVILADDYSESGEIRIDYLDESN